MDEIDNTIWRVAICDKVTHQVTNVSLMARSTTDWNPGDDSYYVWVDIMDTWEVWVDIGMYHNPDDNTFYYGEDNV